MYKFMGLISLAFIFASLTMQMTGNFLLHFLAVHMPPLKILPLVILLPNSLPIEIFAALKFCP